MTSQQDIHKGTPNCLMYFINIFWINNKQIRLLTKINKDSIKHINFIQKFNNYSLKIKLRLIKYCKPDWTGIIKVNSPLLSIIYRKIKHNQKINKNFLH